MNLLALDTSSDACSVALSTDGAVVFRHETRAREHTRLLLPMIRELTDETGVGFERLDAVVLGNGPGSFIGMRIAASVAQGIAFGAALPVVPVSSMAAVAVDVFANEDASYAAVAQDAHMQEVYFGLYRRSSDGLAEGVGDERIATPGPIAELDELEATDCVAAGVGWQLQPELARANAGRVAVSANYPVPHAKALIRLGESAYAAGAAIAPDAVNPAYLRQKVAQIPRRQSRIRS